MKTLLGLFLILVFTLNSFGAPVVFKAQKQIDSLTNYIEASTFDASSYHKIRIGISSDNTGFSQEILIQGFEDNEEYVLTSTDERFLSKTFFVDEPPAKIRIMIKGKGLYKIRVWGTR